MGEPLRSGAPMSLEYWYPFLANIGPILGAFPELREKTRQPCRLPQHTGAKTLGRSRSQIILRTGENPHALLPGSMRRGVDAQLRKGESKRVRSQTYDSRSGEPGEALFLNVRTRTPDFLPSQLPAIPKLPIRMIAPVVPLPCSTYGARLREKVIWEAKANAR